MNEQNLNAKSLEMSKLSTHMSNYLSLWELNCEIPFTYNVFCIIFLWLKNLFIIKSVFSSQFLLEDFFLILFNWFLIISSAFIIIKELKKHLRKNYVLIVYEVQSFFFESLFKVKYVKKNYFEKIYIYLISHTSTAWIQQVVNTTNKPGSLIRIGQTYFVNQFHNDQL